MIYLLDTNACIELLRPGRGGSIRARIAAMSTDDAVLCSIVRLELLFGAIRSRDRERGLTSVRTLIAQFASLPFDDDAAEHAADIREQLASAGTPIGTADLLIAGIARSAKATLVTHNTAEFSRVRGLAIEDWQAA